MLSYILAALTAAFTFIQQPAADLKTELTAIIADAPGTVGLAYVDNSDTIAINNDASYPMMSVFKLHQALAIANAAPLDSSITVKQSDLDPQTWSPMLAVYTDSVFTISLRQLIRHSLVESDNNASNLLFDRILSPAETDRYVRSIAPDTTFAIRHTEAAMKLDHELSRENFSSPLSAALLLRRLFTDADLQPAAALDTIRRDLTAVTTGQDRIGAAISTTDGTLFAHKTGSGYRDDRGRLIAFNDVAYIRQPNGCDYALAIMLRDFPGSETEAARLLARLSETIAKFHK